MIQLRQCLSSQLHELSRDSFERNLFRCGNRSFNQALSLHNMDGELARFILNSKVICVYKFYDNHERKCEWVS